MAICEPRFSTPLGIAQPGVLIPPFFDSARFRSCFELCAQQVRTASSGGRKTKLPAALEVTTRTLEYLSRYRPSRLKGCSDLRHRLNWYASRQKWLEPHRFNCSSSHVIHRSVFGHNAVDLPHLSLAVNDDDGCDVSFEGPVLNRRPDPRFHRQQILPQRNFIKQQRLQRLRVSDLSGCVEESRRNFSQVFEFLHFRRYLWRSNIHRSRDHSPMKALIILKLATPSETACIKQKPGAVLQSDP